MKLNNKNFLSVALFSLSTLILFGLFTNVEAQKKSASKTLITIERGVCYGICPVYSAQISGDGTVVYNGIENVKVKGKKRFKISKNKVQELVTDFERIKFFSMKDKYDTDENGMRILDLSPITLSISLNGKNKKVVNQYGAPKEFNQLADKIDEIAGLTQFVRE